MVWEAPNGPHLYAINPKDMLEAVRQCDPSKKQSNHLCVLIFDVASGWWGEVQQPDEWSREIIRAILQELYRKYGKFLGIQICCRKTTTMHDFMDCLSGDEEFLPSGTLITCGTVYLDVLKDWIDKCKILVWMNNVIVKVPDDMDTATVKREHEKLCEKVFGVLPQLNYESVSGSMHDFKTCAELEVKAPEVKAPIELDLD